MMLAQETESVLRGHGKEDGMASIGSLAVGDMQQSGSEEGSDAPERTSSMGLDMVQTGSMASIQVTTPSLKLSTVNLDGSEEEDFEC